MITLLGQATGIAISTARTTRAAEKVHASVLKAPLRATPDVKRELQFAANNLRNALGEIEQALAAISDATRATRPTGTASVDDAWVQGAKGVAR